MKIDWFQIGRIVVWVLSAIGLFITLPLRESISTDSFEQGTFILLVLAQYLGMPFFMEWINIQREKIRLEERVRKIEEAISLK